MRSLYDARHRLRLHARGAILELELTVKMSPAPVTVTMVLSPACRSDSGVD